MPPPEEMPFFFQQETVFLGHIVDGADGLGHRPSQSSSYEGLASSLQHDRQSFLQQMFRTRIPYNSQPAASTDTERGAI